MKLKILFCDFGHLSLRNNAPYWGRKVVLLLLLAVVSIAEAQEEARIVTGAERIDQYLHYTQHKTVAIVANQASMVGDCHLVDTLLAIGVHVKYILCPEHGFRGNAEAGATIHNSVDSATGIPIISLYGNNKKPKSEQLPGVEVILFDLQDVGCRFYTYISTLHYVMEYCAENPIESLILLDRPNPNGSYVDGPVMESQYTSFVGMHPGVPVVYGMTIGEYATMINEEHWLAGGKRCPLHVVTMNNYTHDSAYRLPIPPSPNLQTAQAIALYPSLCLFEGTNISVGRGTDHPFEYIGAPSFKGYHGDIKAITFTPHTIKGVSENPPFKNVRCEGLDLREVVPAKAFDLTYLLTMYKHTNHADFFLKSNFFEKLAGTNTLRQQLKSGASEEEIRASWESGIAQFKVIRQKYLLYP